MSIHWTETHGINNDRSALGTLVTAATSIIQKWRDGAAQRKQQRIDREAFRQLLELDNEILDDIGVSRADVEWANTLPLSFNASHELERVARGVDPDTIYRARPKRRH